MKCCLLDSFNLFILSLRNSRPPVRDSKFKYQSDLLSISVNKFCRWGSQSCQTSEDPYSLKCFGYNVISVAFGFKVCCNDVLKEFSSLYILNSMSCLSPHNGFKINVFGLIKDHSLCLFVIYLHTYFLSMSVKVVKISLH